MRAPSDFRSDTVTRPTPEMRRAMAEAEVGDDVLDGDPTVAKLEARVAGWLGKEAALFVPSGTMANQVALGAWTRPGDEILVEEGAHIVRYEGGATGYLHGLQTATLPSASGALDPGALAANVRPDFIHCPRTTLICVEQTHMGSGGSVVPIENLRAVQGVARDHGLPVHMDGARLGHAVVAAGIPAADYGACVDSVSVCFSKGLGAPVGSAIAGGADFIERARVVRKRLGGWMRQAGIIAAGALWALDHGLERLAEDHELARDLASVLATHPSIHCDSAAIQTNLVLARVEGGGWDATRMAEALGERGVSVLPLGAGTLRFVTHRDVGRDDLERLRGALAELPPRP